MAPYERVLSVRRLHNDHLAALCGASAESIWCAASTGNEKANHAMVDEIAERDDLPRLRKSGLAVLDLDQKDGKDGQTTLRVLELENGLLPPTLTQRTTSGGAHLIFNGKIKTTVGARGH